MLVEGEECFGVWPKHEALLPNFLKEDYYVSEIDLFNFFRFGAVSGQ